MNNVSCQRLVNSILGELVVSTQISGGILYIQVSSDVVLRCMTILATNSESLFASLTDCFAVTYNSAKQYHEIYYQLHSYKLNTTIFVVATIRNDNLIQSATIQSATILFSNANWYEREIFEKNGINFANHPNLANILES